MPAELATLPQIRPAPVSVRKKHTVLIIDDDDTLSAVLSHRLKQQGFQTVAAYSGSAGLERAKAQPPSAVILDLGLPDVDGLSICGQLADSPGTCATPIIVLSGRDQPGLVRRLPGGRMPLLPPQALRSQRPAGADPSGHRRRIGLGHRAGRVRGIRPRLAPASTPGGERPGIQAFLSRRGRRG